MAEDVIGQIYDPDKNQLDFCCQTVSFRSKFGLYLMKPIYSRPSQVMSMIAEADVGTAGQEESNSSIVLLSSKYALRNVKEISDFLSNNKHILPLLIESHYNIRDYFPTETLSLEVMTDPDEVGEKELVVYICTGLKPSDAIEKLDRLDESWWLDASAISEPKLLIQVEYE